MYLIQILILGKVTKFSKIGKIKNGNEIADVSLVDNSLQKDIKSIKKFRLLIPANSYSITNEINSGDLILVEGIPYLNKYLTRKVSPEPQLIIYVKKLRLLG